MTDNDRILWITKHIEEVCEDKDENIIFPPEVAAFVKGALEAFWDHGLKKDDSLLSETVETNIINVSKLEFLNGV